MSNRRGGLTVPKTGQRATLPAVKGFYRSDTAGLAIPPGASVPIPPLAFIPPAGTYLVTLSIHADAVGVTAPGIAISAGVIGIIADSVRPIGAAVGVTAMTQTRVSLDGTQPVEAVSTGSVAPTTFFARSLSLIRLSSSTN